MEIERKYLLEKIPFDLSEFRKIEIEQGYISENPVIRIRKYNKEFYLTVKSKAKGQGKPSFAKEEFEIKLNHEQFTRLQKKVETKYIKKTRYLVPIGFGLTAELDVYYGELEGLFTVEVEFKSIKQAERFSPPHWFGRDLTFDIRYSNNKLARYGKPQD